MQRAEVRRWVPSRKRSAPRYRRTILCSTLTGLPSKAAAKAEVGKVTRSGQRLVVSDYIIDEAVTLAKARSGARVASRILGSIEQSIGIRVERIDVGRFDERKRSFAGMPIMPIPLPIARASY